MQEYRHDPPPPRQGRAGAFTALILALVIIVGAGGFLLARHCGGLVEEAPDAPDVLPHATTVEHEGHLTKELIFYNSDGELIIIPEEAASAIYDARTDGDRQDEAALPQDIQELLAQIERINAEDPRYAERTGQTVQPAAGTENGELPPDFPSGVTTYSVQVGAFGERDNADALKERLGADGFPAFVLSPSAGAASPVFRVRVGPFAEAEDARSTATELEAMGYSTYIAQ